MGSTDQSEIVYSLNQDSNQILSSEGLSYGYQHFLENYENVCKITVAIS